MAIDLLPGLCNQRPQWPLKVVLAVKDPMCSNFAYLPPLMICYMAFKGSFGVYWPILRRNSIFGSQARMYVDPIRIISPSEPYLVNWMVAKLLR